MTAAIIIILAIALCVACWYLFDLACNLAVADRNLDARQRVIDDLRALKEKKYPDLSWTVDPKLGTTELLDQVKDKKLAYTIADSVAISLFQRVHPEIAVALDVTDEQPVCLPA